MSSTYLLKATEGEMTTWKAAAENAGISFAQWLRDAANRHIPDGTSKVGVQHSLALEEAAVSIPAAGDGEQARAARQAPAAAVSSSAKRRSSKLDPGCTNAQYHWRVEPGNVCTYCGGSR